MTHKVSGLALALVRWRLKVTKWMVSIGNHFKGENGITSKLSSVRWVI